MQYVGQIGRALKKRFGEHYRRMNKPKNDNFLYRDFKRKCHAPANILVQPVEKITNGANSTRRVGRPQTSSSPQVISLLDIPRRLFCFGSLVILMWRVVIYGYSRYI